MEVLMSVVFLIFIISLSLRVLPRIIGFTFSFIIGMIQIMLALMLIPVIGIIFFMGFDFFMLMLLIIFFRVIR